MTRDQDTTSTRHRPREPLNWPTAAIGLGALAFLGWVVFLVVGLIRDLAG